MKQSNKQSVFFQNNGQWYTNQIDLKKVYTSVHADKAGYGSSANVLINEMMANLLDLARQNKIHLTQPFVITDFGCGQSKASNVLARVVSDTCVELEDMLRAGRSYGNILSYLAPIITAADEAMNAMPRQITRYKHIIVQRFDIGIPEFSTPLGVKADVTFCNDVFEHIPLADIPAFVRDLEASGDFVIASISLRDAVNYNKVDAEILLDGAKPVDQPKGLVLTQDESGAYIFSLHVSIMPQNVWQAILGSNWHLLPAQDYTACSAMNFEPSPEYQAYKRDLISQLGFADFIPLPTPIGSRYQNDPILFRRVVKMQPQKHLFKLNALESYPQNDFARRERAASMAFFDFIGVTPVKNEKTGLWELAQELPADYISKLSTLDRLSKRCVNPKAQDANRQAAANADKLIAAYNNGNTKLFED